MLNDGRHVHPSKEIVSREKLYLRALDPFSVTSKHQGMLCTTDRNIGLVTSHSGVQSKSSEIGHNNNVELQPLRLTRFREMDIETPRKILALRKERRPVR